MYKKCRKWVMAPSFIIGGVLCCLGIWFSLFASPIDYQQKETVRIMYIHVPASWLALGIYAFMGLSSIGGFIWRHSLGFVFTRAAWPIGFCMGVISLLTGSIWGKPMWGTWWVWDARLTSMLVLVLLYLAYGVLMQAAHTGYGSTAKRPLISQEELHKRGSILVCIGLLNLPIIKFSVEWWSTLHQPASVIREGGMAIAPEMAIPLFVTFFGMLLVLLGLGIMRVDTLLMRQKYQRCLMIQDRLQYARQDLDEGLERLVEKGTA